MNKWEALFEQFNSMRVMVIGDLMVDSYLFGKVERISPEAPVPVVSVERRDYRLGGAANVALNLRGLGADVAIFSVTGEDEMGDRLAQLLLADGIDIAGLVRSKERKTTVKHRIIGNSHHMLRLDDEDLHGLRPSEESILVQRIIDAIARFDVIIFEDYDKGVLGESLIQAVIALAGELDIPTVVDPKKQNFLSYRGATLFKPNLKEIKEGLNITESLKDEDTLKTAVARVREKLDGATVLLTLSERGILISNGVEWVQLPAHVRNISDVSGAGDTVVSVAALCLAGATSLKDIAFLANIAGGLVCEKVGVVPIEKNTLLHEAIKLDH